MQTLQQIQAELTRQARELSDLEKALDAAKLEKAVYEQKVAELERSLALEGVPVITDEALLTWLTSALETNRTQLDEASLLMKRTQEPK